MSGLARRFRVLTAALVVACLAAPVVAQETSTYLRQLRGTEIPLPEAQFLLYQYLAGSGSIEADEELQSEVRTRLEIGNARFYALMDHMRETIDASQAFSEAQNSELCARRANLGTIKALGDALNAGVAQLRARQAELMREASSILGDVGEPRFIALLQEYRVRMRISHVDYTALLVERKVDLSVALDDLCGSAAPAQREGPEGRAG
jgi:hypothetical protein